MPTNLPPKIYAPTRTETWDFCHVKGDLAHVERWVPNRLDKRGLSMYVGRAFAAAMAALHTGKEPLLKAREIFHSEITHLREAGVEIEQQDVDELAAALGKAVEKYLPSDPLTASAGWQVQDVELTLPNHGHARIDWGGLDPTGALVQVDYKLKLNLEQRWHDKEIERYRYSTQMLHYCWAYGAYKGAPVNRYYICLVVLAPRFYVEVIPYEVDPELLAAWLRSSEQKWEDMHEQEQGRRVPDMASTHRDAYGDCPFQRACLEFRLDPTLMRTAYVQVLRRDDAN